MADDHHHGDIIIIRKKVVGGHPHHGGAWKIAFADFMTAMMAFFLVLWIINATDKDTKTVIARYFNPVKLENPSRANKGVHGSTSGPTDGNQMSADLAAGPPTNYKNPKAPPPLRESNPEKQSAGAVETPSKDVKARTAEEELFASPYETLDRIAGAPNAVSLGASPDKGDADPQRLNGSLSVDSFRDPFKPIGPGSPDDPVAYDADARNRAPPNLEPGKSGDKDNSNQNYPAVTPKPGEKTSAGEAPKPAPTPASGLAESGKAAVGDKGAGPAKVEGASSPKSEGESAPKSESATAAKVEKEVKQKVEAVIGAGAGPEIEARQTKDGLLISLTDKLDFSMFAIGSAEPRAELVKAMAAIAKVVKATPGHVVVRGYTDARPYRNGAYDNWRLSSDRAQMAYYMLTRGGAEAARFVRVEGYADRALKDPAHPLSAVNRRLEILIESPKP
jgi:chemotaxis protein MotB